MSYWNRSQWNSWDNQWQQQQSPPPPPPSSSPPVSLPSNWRSTSQCWDDQVQYGYRLHRSIQPTAWSRKRNLAGQVPLSVPLSHLTRHGPDEAALRALSEGRFVGIICAKSVAESVFGSQILKTFRDQGIDIDATAESLHRQLAPQQGIPNRTDKPIEFMAPLVQFIADKLKAQCPVKQKQLYRSHAKAPGDRSEGFKLPSPSLHKQAFRIHPRDHGVPPALSPLIPNCQLMILMVLVLLVLLFLFLLLLFLLLTGRDLARH